jgi:FtsZ-binding cell division protein ZapB
MIEKTLTMTIILLVLSLVLVACSPNTGSTDLENDLKAAKEKIEALNEEYNDSKDRNKILEKEKEELEKQIQNLENSNSGSSNSSINLVDFSLDIMELIKDNDMNGLSTYVHPSKGLRFTPYTYIDIQNDKVFTASEVSGLNGDNSVYTWGNYDGSGDPIDLKFSDYYSEFVYNQDFLNPHMIGNNVVIGTGNMTDNTSTAYPNGSFVEYHFTGFDSQYEGMDWESLTLVFEEDNGDWYLVGIIHEQWTV